MRRFMLKCMAFVAPFVILYFAFLPYRLYDKGDLSRIGTVLHADSDYHKRIGDDRPDSIYYVNLSKADLTPRKKYDVLNVGDSFTQKDEVSYQNYLARDGRLSVLNIDSTTNAIHTVSALANSNTLQAMGIRYVVVQSVERLFVKRGLEARSDERTELEHLRPWHGIQKDEQSIPPFFSPATLTYPLHGLLYQLDDNAVFGKVYRVPLQRSLFSSGEREVMFLGKDKVLLKYNNDTARINRVNEVLNDLGERLALQDIQLIVVPAPNKYTIYHNYFQDRDRYPAPTTLSYLSQLPKSYTYIDTRALLLRKVEDEEDLYFYDDTHWSPSAAKAVSQQILEAMKR